MTHAGGTNRPMRGNPPQQWCFSGAISEYLEPDRCAPDVRSTPRMPSPAAPVRRRWRLIGLILLGVLALLSAPNIGRASVAAGPVAAGVPPDASQAPANTTPAATGAGSETTNVAPSATRPAVATDATTSQGAQAASTAASRPANNATSTAAAAAS